MMILKWISIFIVVLLLFCVSSSREYFFDKHSFFESRTNHRPLTAGLSQDEKENIVLKEMERKKREKAEEAAMEKKKRDLEAKKKEEEDEKRRQNEEEDKRRRKEEEDKRRRKKEDEKKRQDEFKRNWDIHLAHEAIADCHPEKNHFRENIPVLPRIAHKEQCFDRSRKLQKVHAKPREDASHLAPNYLHQAHKVMDKKWKGQKPECYYNSKTQSCHNYHKGRSCLFKGKDECLREKDHLKTPKPKNPIPIHTDPPVYDPKKNRYI